MNILDLKRGLLALRGVRGLGSDTDGGADTGVNGTTGGMVGGGGNSDGGYGSGTPSFGGDYGGSYASPDLSAMTISPDTGLTAAQKQAANDVVMAVERGIMTPEQAREALSKSGLSPKAASFVGGMLGFLSGIPGGSLLGQAAGKAMSSDDPFGQLASLAAGVQKGVYGTDNQTAFGSYSIQGDGGSGTTLGSIFTGATGAQTAPTNIMGDLWGSLGIDPVAFGGTGTSARTPVAYQADPTGLVGQAGQAYTDYKAQSSPWLASMGDEVKRLNSADYLAQQRGKAMADVQQQSDAQIGIAQRNMRRMGVNPSSGRMLALNNQNAMQTAAAKAGAANASDVTNKQNHLSGMGTMLTGLNDQAKTGYSFGTLGQQSAQNANNFNLANDQQNLSWTENAQKYPMQWAQLGLNKYATDKGVAQTQMNLDAKSDSDNKSLLGMGLTLGAKALDWF